MTSNMDASKTENNSSSHIDDKRDALVQEAEEALHGVQLSMLSDPALKAEMPPFFSKECRHILSACMAGYFATTLYGYDAGSSIFLIFPNRQVLCLVSML
jgi:hypothetical protein